MVAQPLREGKGRRATSSTPQTGRVGSLHATDASGKPRSLKDTPIIGLELICAAIVALFIAAKLRGGSPPGRLFARLSLLMVASWIGETTMIRAYDFYSYSPRWHLFIDHVPLSIVSIWPVVIYSAWDLSRSLTHRGSVAVVLGGGAIVFTDAWLIEPIAVHAGLWQWTHPGLFGVPPVGVFGWAVFAAACLMVLQHAERHPKRWWIEGSSLLLAPITAHLGVITLWWGGLRWLDRPIGAGVGIAIAWGVSIILTTRLIRDRRSGGASRRDMLLRVPGALFFFSLLALHPEGAGPLLLYAIAFSPPYLVLTWRAQPTHQAGAARLRR